ncbi:MAG: Ig-like domain repeat protein, partial [Armatimonadetes bacterium]|nr:Ig-like domain repeat protein [Armatimonadota bacterium]
NVVQVSAGSLHSVALRSNGTVWAWGYNGYTQLGDGTYVDKATPFQVAGLTGVTQVSAGWYHSLALKNDGTVWAWGYNQYGTLGDGTNVAKASPVQVTGLTGVVQISAGYTTSLALKADGTAWAWGNNSYGQLGDGTFTDSNTPVKVSGLTNASQVSAGYLHSAALKSDGTAWSWGYNGYGQLGDGTTFLTNVPVQVSGLAGAVQIAAGLYHSVALKSDGTAWCWGSNGYGELGDGTGAASILPVQVLGLTGGVQVSAGYSDSLAVKSDGTVWTWGWNAYGQLGDGTVIGRIAPVQVSTVAGQTFASMGGYHGISVQAYVLTTSVSVSPLTQAYGKVITLSATLKNASLGGNLIGKPVAFTVDGVAVGTAATNASGRATVVVPSPLNYGVGAHTFTVAFTADSLYKAATATGALTITKADSAISVAATSGGPGNSKYLYASLKRKTDNKVLSGRTLAFKVDGNAIGTAVTDGKGRASLLYKFSETYAIGTHTLSADYAGDTSHNASTGAGTLAVVQSGTKLTVSSVTGRVGATILIKGKLTRITDNALLNAKAVRFEIDGVEVGSAVTASGIAPLSFTIPNTLTVGVHTLKALFDGDVFYSATDSVGATLTVK